MLRSSLPLTLVLLTSTTTTIHGATAACTSNALTSMQTCLNKVSIDANKCVPPQPLFTPATTPCPKRAIDDVTKICGFVQRSLICYPQCYCQDPAFAQVLKDTEEQAEKAVIEAGGVSEGSKCIVKCGNSWRRTPELILAVIVFSATYSQYE